MKKGFLKTGLLSLTASTLLVSGLSAANTIQSASIDLESYDMVKIVFDSLDSATVSAVTVDMVDGNITIENNTTDDNVSLTYEFNTSTEIYASIQDADDVKIIRGNSYNNLTLNVYDSNFDATADDATDFNLTTTLGTLSVENDTWNLITIPAGVYTNAKEMIKANKATMIWGWDLNTSDEYDWVSYPDRMEPGRGYWVRTRISTNTGGDLGDVVASDYNLTLIGDYASDEVNASNFAEVVSFMPEKDEWVLLGNSGSSASIIDASDNSENNSTIYFFEDLLNVPEECYFVSIYHWDASSDAWINDTEGGAGTVPANSGVWVKQRLCNED